MHLCPQESASSWRKKMDSGSQSRTSEVSGTALGRSALREAQQLLGGARCRPSLALPAAVAARGESLAFTVLVSNFLLLSILFRENNVLNKALASSAGAHPTAGRWPLREDNGPAGRWCLVPVLRESGHSGIWRPVRIPASLLFHPWALEASSPQSH